MRKFIYSILAFALLGVLIGCSNRTKGAVAKQGIVLMEGSDLIYEVTVGDETYPFELNINQFGDELISFDWDMDGARSGTIAMHGDVLVTATNLYNYFSGGYKSLKEETSVWVSKDLFKALKSGKPVEIGLGKGKKETFKLSGPETYSFGQKSDNTSYNLPVFIVLSEDQKKEIWIADDPENRLIVMMNLDFRIDLKDFKPY